MTLLKDKRPIKAIFFGDDPEAGFYEVGVSGCTKIEPYPESGEMALVTWFKIWKGEKLICRVNSRYLEVVSYGD